MQCTLSGTLFVYQGEEIGMANLPKSWGIEEYEDIATQEYYSEELEAERKKQATSDPDMSEVWDNIRRKARDHARSPMQWTDGKQAGFSDADSMWMRANEDYPECNAAKQTGDKGSVLGFWRRMLAFRKKHLACVSPAILPAFDISCLLLLQTYGVFTHLSPKDERVFAYTKAYGDQTLFVALNFTKETVEYSEVPSLGSITDRIGNYPEDDLDFDTGAGKLKLRPWEAVMMAAN